jgi:hypothetical protein
MLNILNIGVVGYTGMEFDKERASHLLNDGFDTILSNHPVDNVNLISGLTSRGVPGIAYRIAVERGWQTFGVACAKETKYECFPVANRIIVGNTWGDENEKFLSMCDVVLRVGGGKRALAIATQFMIVNRGQVYEYELDAIDS